ncbi:MAG: response regulator [Candidatus Altiarchaeota archaeon]
MARILVVDDEPEIIDILTMILQQAGYEVDSAPSGQECIKKAVDGKYDAILLDVRMPALDGWKTLKKLKEDGIADKLKIIMLTVEKGPGVEIFGLQDVVDDYIIKPFDKNILLKHIREVLG